MAQPNIPGYRIESLLGRGGFATVYLGIDETGAEAAIKVLHAHATTEGDLKRFDRERMSMTALSGHPNIVDVRDSGETVDGDRYLVLEYVGGGSVRERLDGAGAMHWADVTSIGVQICAALDAAHRSGVLHRDVKPANILVEDGLAKLGDFGIARLVGQTQLTAAQSLIGTLAYTPPELFHNRPFDGRGDIYQLGISLYEMLLGRAPFTSTAADNKATVIRRILENPAPPLAQFDVPRPLSDLLDSVLAKDPDDRPQSAAEFGRLLNEVEVRLGRPATGVDRPTTDAPTGPLPAGLSATETVAPIASAAETVADESPTQSRPLPTPNEPAAARSIVIADPDRTPPAEPTGSGSHGAEQPPARPSATTPSRWPRALGALAAAALVAGAAWAGWRLSQPDDDAGPATTTTEPRSTTTEPPATTESTAPTTTAPAVAFLDQAAITATIGSDAVMFDAVANSQGLTAVGASGDGERVGEQSSVIWTMAADGSWALRDDFASADELDTGAQRLWDIGVLEGLQLFAVGDTAGNGTDGVAWIGLTAAAMRPVPDPSFTGPGSQSLRGVVGDEERTEFIVVGQRADGSSSVPGLWIVREGASWSEPDWTAVPVGSGATGVLNDVTLGADLAAAVGNERVDGRDRGLVFVRRGTDWAPLLEPIADSTLEAVVVTADRVIAVGTRRLDGTSVPIAVVTDHDGQGFVHTLPVGRSSGRAHGALAAPDGSVVVVGDVGEVEGDQVFTDRRTDAAVWQFVPGDRPADDAWAARHTELLRADGYQELWAAAAFDGRLFLLGRADDGARAPAAVWELDPTSLGAA